MQAVREWGKGKNDSAWKHLNSVMHKEEEHGHVQRERKRKNWNGGRVRQLSPKELFVLIKLNSKNLLLCQFTWRYQNTDMLHQMIISPGSCKRFGPLNPPWHSRRTRVQNLFFLKKICLTAQMGWREVIPPTTRVINTQIFLLLSQISQLLLNQSLCPGFHISRAACKIIPKFPFTVLGLLLCTVDQYERVSGGSKEHEKFKRNGSGIWEDIPACLPQIVLSNLPRCHIYWNQWHTVSVSTYTVGISIYCWGQWPYSVQSFCFSSSCSTGKKSEHVKLKCNLAEHFSHLI